MTGKMIELLNISINTETNNMELEHPESGVCPSCGSMIDTDDKYCPICGKLLVITDITDNIEEDSFDLFCPNCGNRIEQGAEFCPSCGTRVIDNYQEKKNAQIETDKDYKEVENKLDNVIAEEIKPETKYQTEKKSSAKTGGIILAISVVIIAAILGVYFAIIKPGNIYKQAMALKERNKYEEAYELFVSLNNYKDSKDQSAECKEVFQATAYNEALLLYANNKYDEAIEKLSKIEDYSDSKNLIEKISSDLVYYVVNKLVSNDSIVINNSWQNIELINGKRESIGKISGLSYKCTSDFAEYTENADVEYGYENNTLIIKKVTNESKNTKLTGNMSKDMLYYRLENEYFNYLQSNGYEFGELVHLANFKQKSDNEYIIRFAVMKYNMDSIVQKLELYESIMKYDFEAGEWKNVSRNKIGDSVKVKNIHDVQINVRDEPNKNGTVKAVLDFDKTIELKSILDDYYNSDEYRWYGVKTNDGSEQWIAERRTQDWYQIVME